MWPGGQHQETKIEENMSGFVYVRFIVGVSTLGKGNCTKNKGKEEQEKGKGKEVNTFRSS